MAEDLTRKSVQVLYAEGPFNIGLSISYGEEPGKLLLGVMDRESVQHWKTLTELIAKHLGTKAILQINVLGSMASVSIVDCNEIDEGSMGKFLAEAAKVMIRLKYPQMERLEMETVKA